MIENLIYVYSREDHYFSVRSPSRKTGKDTPKIIHLTRNSSNFWKTYTHTHTESTSNLAKCPVKNNVHDGRDSYSWCNCLQRKSSVRAPRATFQRVQYKEQGRFLFHRKDSKPGVDHAKLPGGISRVDPLKY